MKVSSATLRWSSVKYYLNLFHLSLLYQVKEFFQSSTLHGVKYIAETDRPFAERFMWFIFTATGTISALVIIASLWEKFQINPTITGLDTNFQTTTLVFPTVLICPTEAFDDQAVVDVASNLFNAQESDGAGEYYEDVMRDLMSLSVDNVKQFYNTAKNVTTTTPLEDRNLRELMFLLRVKCQDVLESCNFKEEYLNCCDHFQPMFTEMGFCYGLNTKYVYSGGPKTGSGELQRNENMIDLLETDKKWALVVYPKLTSKIYIHSQLEVSSLEMATPAVTWNTDHSLDILVSLKETITTEDTKQLSVGQRKCIFPDEIRLEFFPQDEYTFSSCMMECRMKLSLKLCNCVLPFYATLVDVPPKVPLNFCTLKEFPCLIEYSGNLTNLKDCSQCELSCTLVIYEIDKLSKTSASEGVDGPGPYINIEYLTWPIIRYKREVLFGWVDLLVSFGGIAGLFLGFSILSGVEIIYFFTLRALCMVFKEEDKLVEIDRMKKEKPLEEFYLGLKLKNLSVKKRNDKKVHFKPELIQKKPSKLMIFDGPHKEIPDFVVPKVRPAPYASRATGIVHPAAAYNRQRRIMVRSRVEEVPIFPYLP